MSRRWLTRLAVAGWMWSTFGGAGPAWSRQPLPVPDDALPVLSSPARPQPRELPPPRPVDSPSREAPQGASAPSESAQKENRPAAPAHPAPPLHLAEVLASADRHYPLLLAVLQEQGIASGQLLAAQGAFDLNLRGREFLQAGTFSSHRFNVGVDQNLAAHGISYFAGYRQAMGTFPIYYGDRKTGEGGELRAGVLIPLLAGNAIDARRARILQADIARRLADPAIASQRIDVLRAAARAYWTWVGAGRRYQVTESVLRLAQRRDRQLAELVQKGQIAAIERTDNQRVLVERQARLVAAERVWQQATIALSLYLRDPAGCPLLAPACRLPQAMPEPVPPTCEQVARDAELALTLRPELARLRLQRERVGVDLELAKNQLLPGLNFGLEGYQDLGYGSSFSKTPLVKGTQLDRTTYIASLQLDVPLQRRDARGRILTAESTLAQLLQQERFQRDRIAAEVADAASALRQAAELLKKAREGLSVARKVEAAENERFLRGQGTLLILNLRELVTAEAAFGEVDALAEYHRALADYRAAVGVDAAPCPPRAKELILE